MCKPTDTPRVNAEEYPSRVMQPTRMVVDADFARLLERELQAANDMLARITGICDRAGIPKTDGDVPALEIEFCEGYRVEMLATAAMKQSGLLPPTNNA